MDSPKYFSSVALASFFCRMDTFVLIPALGAGGYHEGWTLLFRNQRER